MKIKLSFTVFLISTIFCWNIAAQQASTAANPIWYYIQVKGANTYTYDRVITEMEDGQILGRPLAAGSIDEINKQLWRFEIPSGVQGYRVINKSSGKQMTVALHEATGQRRPVVTEVSTVFWIYENISGNSTHKKWKIVTEPSFGTAGEIYLSQTPYNSYAYRTVTSTAATTDNEQYRFVKNEIPIISSDASTVWLNIRNSKNNKYLTDAVASAPGKNFTLEAKDGNSSAQQWKLTDKGNGNVEIINRATGNIISSETNLNKYYYVNYTTQPAQSDGWSYEAIGGAAGQYTISTTNADGVTSYWNATTDGQATDAYAAGNAASSTYAWIFTWAEVVTDFVLPEVGSNIRVYAANRRIYVEGTDEYTVTAISGLPVRKNAELPQGIYLVSIKGKTQKILVK
jgi:hypothetical protein